MVEELCDESVNALFDVVADRAHGLEIESGRIAEGPVEVADAGIEGTFVTAPIVTTTVDASTASGVMALGWAP